MTDDNNDKVSPIAKYRREKNVLSPDERVAQNHLANLEKQIRDLHYQLIDLEPGNRYEQSNIFFQISLLEKAKKFAERFQNKVQRYRDYCDEEYIRLVQGLSTQEEVYKTVATMLSIDDYKEYDSFLQLMHQTRYLKLARKVLGADLPWKEKAEKNKASLRTLFCLCGRSTTPQLRRKNQLQRHDGSHGQGAAFFVAFTLWLLQQHFATCNVR